MAHEVELAQTPRTEAEGEDWAAGRCAPDAQNTIAPSPLFLVELAFLCYDFLTRNLLLCQSLNPTFCSLTI
jgi:hypothetical protein